ncbi:MAG TPA: C40 family peptidase [Chthonomonadaceae bacterium]|nr:C40 family peptidase [Chthonomonadaceae bacterium]
MWLKWTPLQAVAGAAVVSLSALVPLAVSADPPSSPSASAAAGGNLSPTQQTLAAPGVIHTVPPTSVQSTAPSRSLSRGQYLARTALSYRGVPYRWGGRSSRTGFDCSGLVQAVCAKWGIYLPRVARAQYKVGDPVKPENLQPGDLVFFKNTYRHGLSHVGIYIGQGCFIHAPGRGKAVMVSRLDESYYKNHWAGARHLNLSKLPPVPGEEKTPVRVILDDTVAQGGVESVPARSADPTGAAPRP